MVADYRGQLISLSFPVPTEKEVTQITKREKEKEKEKEQERETRNPTQMGSLKTLSGDLRPKPPPSLLFLLILHLLPSSSSSSSSANIFDLIYKGCATQSFSSSGDGVFSGQQSLAALSSSLVTQSSSAKFFKTTVASSNGQPPLFGLFQCRGDLLPADCAACVSRIPPLWGHLCGQSVAARVHLAGCYALYEISNFPQVSGTKMLYKACGSGGGGAGFEEKRDTTFANLESVMASGSSGGYYATSFGNVYAMAQCEGDLSVGDCAECVTQAAQKAAVECGGASSGQIYLDKCFLGYSSNSEGIIHGGGGGGGGGGSSSGQPTGKTVAIVVGGAAGVGFFVIILLFARSLYKKRDDD